MEDRWPLSDPNLRVVDVVRMGEIERLARRAEPLARREPIPDHQRRDEVGRFVLEPSETTTKCTCCDLQQGRECEKPEEDRHANRGDSAGTLTARSRSD